jgi:phosphoserine phosphatase
VSGGFVAQARRAQIDLRIRHAYAATDLYWGDDGKLVHWNIYPSDFDGKVDFVNLLIREYGFGTEECAFVGDGANDVAIASAVGVSFAYNAHQDLRSVASHAITDFRQILTLLP